MAGLQHMFLDETYRLRQDGERNLRRILAKVGVARGEQRIPDGTGNVNHEQPHASPAESQRDQPETDAPASLEEQRPQAEHEDHAWYLFLTGQTEDHETKEPECLSRIQEVEGKEQQRGRQGHGMKIVVDGVLLCRVQQVEQCER